MKKLKDCEVLDDAYYAVLGYIHDTDYKDIYEKHWETYDEKTRLPQFSVLDLNKEQFTYLLEKAFKFFKNNIKELPSE